MSKKRKEKEGKKRESKEQVRATEVEEDGVATEEARVEIMMRGTTAIEEIEEDTEQEEEVVTEVVDEVYVGRNLLPLPRRCLPRLWQEVSK